MDDDTDDPRPPWAPPQWDGTPWWRRLVDAVELPPTLVAALVLAGAAVVAVAAVAAVVLWPRSTASIDAALPDAVPLATSPPPVTAADVQVHVAGAVARPGVYRLPAGSRVADVVGAAGGLTTDADPDRVNLAAELPDGSQVVVPRVGEEVPATVAPTGDPSGAGGGGGAATVDVNTAGVAELEELPGIGPTLADAIVRHRETHGPFVTLDDLTAVAGIGPAKLEALRDAARV